MLMWSVMGCHPSPKSAETNCVALIQMENILRKILQVHHESGIHDRGSWKQAYSTSL